MTAPDLARVLGVPTVYARVNAAELDEWNRRQEAAHREYDRDGFAASRIGTRACFTCRTGDHYRCNSSASVLNGTGICSCFIDDHRRTA